MKAMYLEKGDVLFTADFEASPIRECYLANSEVLVIAFENNTGMQCHPDRELLVARKGQIL
jgi:hypothetical protein